MKQKPSFTIIYKDDSIVVVSKISGLAVCRDRYDVEREHLDKLLGDVLHKRLYLVHRIDADTSGLVIFAKDEGAHKALSQAFENRLVHKEYIAVLQGRPVWKTADCDYALVPDGNKKHETIVDKFHGKKSLTHFTVLCVCGNWTLVLAEPETGRTHQIRVHAASMGHPVVCDPIYGSNKPLYLSALKKKYRGDSENERPIISRLALHASKIILPDYDGHGIKTFEAPLPRDMNALVTQMKKNGKEGGAQPL
ncbi:RNA pseudouridine synthase [Spirochaetia bacterium]|nr:RNA pseudouridine synthase [Spirochaetia bacterium]